MIVVGILTALTLEHIVVGIHDRHMAEASYERIAGELRANLDQVNDAIAQNETHLRNQQDAQASITDDLRKGLSNEKVNEHIGQLFAHKEILGMINPTLRREAWDVAMANGSLAHMDADTLRRLAAAYAALHDSEQPDFADQMVAARGAEMLLVASTGLELHTGSPVDMVNALKVSKAAQGSYLGNLKALREALQRAVGSEAGPRHS
ncbi:MAG: hypothetical protein JO218_17660 [Burkholderiales bacterium]|nr:hypothetical protein [Burkholderiales bacterium]